MKQILLISISSLFIGCATVVPNNVCPAKDYKTYKKNANKNTASELIKDAISSKNTQNLKCMLAAGFNSNMMLEGIPYQTPLIFSSTYGNKETSKILLEQNANLEYMTVDGKTAFIAAIDSRNFDIASLLLSKGANIEQKDNIGNTPLIHAAEVGNLPAIKFLLENNANLNAKNYDGETALSKASNAGHDYVVLFLLTNNTEIDNKIAFKILSDAIKSNNMDLLSVILEKTPSLINEKDSSGKTPLILAVSEDNIDAVKFLISKGANKNAQDNNGMTPLMFAARDGQENIFFESLNAGANTKLKSNVGYSALSFSISSQNPNILKALIKKGGDVNEVDYEKKFSPLISYIFSSGFGGEKGNEEIADILIKNKANINFQNDRGETVLMLAIIMHQVNLVNKLLKNHPNINLKDKEGHSIMYHAINHQMIFGGDFCEKILAYSKKYNNSDKNFLLEMEYIQAIADQKMKNIDNTTIEYYKRRGLPEVAIELETKKARNKLVSNLATQIANDYSYKHAVEYIHSQENNLLYSEYTKIAKKFELNNLMEQIMKNPNQFKKKDGSINESLIQKLTPNATPLERLRVSNNLKRK